MKKFFIAAALTCASSMAQMPVPLIDNDAVLVNPTQWKTVAPTLKAALECRHLINPDDPVLRPLLPGKDANQWKLVPPNGFTVFGLPVQMINIYVDASGEMGTSYTALVAVPKSIAIRAAKIKGQRKTKTKVGSLMAEQSSRPSLTNITCTIFGSYDDF